MPNEYKNKIIYNNQILMDLTSDTVTAGDVLFGKTAHDKSGAPITGSCTYDSDTTDADASASEILSGKYAYVNKNKIEGTMTDNASVTGTISTKDEEYSVPAGYHDGGGKVGISSTEKAKLVAANIRSGITVLGVQGSMSGTEGVTAGSKTVTPGASSQTIAANQVYVPVAAGTTFTANKYYELSNGTYSVLASKPSGWDADPTAYYEQCNYISQFTVNAIPYTESDNAAGGVTVTIG